MKRALSIVPTALFSLGMGASGLAYLFQAQPIVDTVHEALGYPMHFLTILGTAKVLGVLALVVPGFPKLREWAYAGFTFNVLGAVWAHLASGHGLGGAAPALVMGLLLAASYATRQGRDKSVTAAVEAPKLARAA